MDRWLAVVACLALAGPGSAAAQLRVVVGDRCEVPAGPSCTDADSCPGADDRCFRAPTDAVGVCAPVGTVFCCTAEARCPDGTGPCGEEVLRFGEGICLDPDADYCEDPPSTLRLDRCHGGPGGGPRTIVPFAEGDCDSDGFRNAEEDERGSDPCVKEHGQLAIDGGDFVCEGPLPACEMLNRACDALGQPGLCQDLGLFSIACRAPRRPLCCDFEDGRAIQCLGNQTCIRWDERNRGVCVPDGTFLCTDAPSLEQIRACVTAPDGEAPVVFASGDCDADGRSNRTELQGGTDPCRADAFPPDAGPPGGVDAGRPERDAGALRDAGAGRDAGSRPPEDGGPGSRLDGAPPTAQSQPNFSGGGGCTCRVGASGQGRAPTLWLVLPAVLLLVRVRRR